MAGVSRVILLAFFALVTAAAAGVQPMQEEVALHEADHKNSQLVSRANKVVTFHSTDLDEATLWKPGQLAIAPRASLVPFMSPHVHPRSASPLRGMDRVQQARRMGVAAEQKTSGIENNTPALLAASTGVVALALAGASGLEGVVPEAQAQAAMLACVGGVTVYGMFRGGPFFREDPWEHSAEMMARSDAGLMGPTSERPPLQATQPGDAAVKVLGEQGVVRLDGVLSAESASSVRSAVIEQLDAVLSEQEGQKRDRARLAKITCEKKRYDLLLKPDGGFVEAAMREALKGPLGELMKAKVGVEASLYELAALVSDSGADRQPVQVDTPYQDEPSMYTAIVALQDEVVELGPTLFLPGTHTETAYKDLMGGDMKRSDLLKRTPFFGSMLRAGDCAVYDSRLLHANGQNIKGRRALLYFTFAKPDADLSQVLPGSILAEAQGSHHLADFLPKVPVS